MTSTPRSPDLIETLAGIVGAGRADRRRRHRAIHRLARPLSWRGALRRSSGQHRSRGGGQGLRAAAWRWCRRAATPATAAPATPDERRAVVISVALNRILAVDRKTARFRSRPVVRWQTCRRRRARIVVPAGAGGRRQLPDRRQPVDQRRWRAGAALRQHARTDAGAGSGAAQWRGLERPARPAQGQHRLRPEAACSSAPRERSASSPRRYSKLFRCPATDTCWLSLPDAALPQGDRLINRAKSVFDARLTAFELVSETALGLVLRISADAAAAARRRRGTCWRVFRYRPGGRRTLAGRLPQENGLLSDGVMAQSATQARRSGRCARTFRGAENRGDQHQARHRRAGVADSRFSVSAGCSLLPDLAGNPHCCLRSCRRRQSALQPVKASAVTTRRLHRQPAGSQCRGADIVHALNGSISAEHGLGQLKREEILRYKSATEMALMRAIKQALDPLGLMNPGKVL